MSDGSATESDRLRNERMCSLRVGDLRMDCLAQHPQRGWSREQMSLAMRYLFTPSGADVATPGATQEALHALQQRMLTRLADWLKV